MFAGVATLSGPERYPTPAVRIPVAVLPEPRAFIGVLVLKGAPARAVEGNQRATQISRAFAISVSASILIASSYSLITCSYVVWSTVVERPI